MTHALESGTGTIRRRALFGLLDADGWGWASVKASIWLVILIMMLGYIPDRAYYFIVNRTIDVGLLAWSPVNFCPPENQNLPCPAPVGAILPWQHSPDELNLPAPRTGGSAIQLGTRVLYVGGTDGSKPVDSVYVANMTTTGNFEPWQAGPSLPEARSALSLVAAGGKLYAFGGNGPGGATDTVWTLDVNAETGALGSWTAVDSLKLPAPRSGAAVASLSDGLVLVGGLDRDGKPTTTAWKSTLDAKGLPGAWSEQADLINAVSGAAALQVGDYLWVIGGTDAGGPSGGVQRGTLGTGVPPVAPGTYVNPADPPHPVKVLQWGINNSANLPAARAGAAVFTANGSIYVAGGADANGARKEIYWAIPNGEGNIPAWQHLDQTDLAGGLVGAAPIVNGANAFLIGGTGDNQVLTSSLRSNLAPQEPFFQLGLVGATIPAMKLEGELGQQLGMLSSAGAGTLNFVIMLLVGWIWAHKPQVRAWVERRRAART